MRSKARVANMREVATAAGVALITVSRALREPDMVHPRTIAKIKEAIESIGYVPNLAARSLLSNESRIIAAIIPSFNNSVFADTAQGLSDTFRSNGYQILFGNSGNSGVERSEEELVLALMGRRPDAFVLTGVTHSEQTRRILGKAGIPVVEMWNLAKKPIDMIVGFSNYDAAKAMVKLAAAKGRRRMAFIGGRFTGNDQADDRKRGYLDGLEEAGLPRHPDLIVETDVPGNAERGAAALRELMSRSQSFDVVICQGDVFAHGVLLECFWRGIRVPHEIAVCGFGDLELSAAIPPGLTTVRTKPYEIGTVAATMIVDVLKGRRRRQRAVDVGFEIIERKSL